MTKDEALNEMVRLGQEMGGYDVEQPAQDSEQAPCEQPVAWTDLEGNFSNVGTAFFHPFPLYTHHAPSWQGLSQEEQWNLINKSDIPADYDHEILAIARAIEQALKEKNT